MTDTYDFQAEAADCRSAEEFLDHFGVAHDRAVLQVYRLHILQRFHDYVDALDRRPASFADYRALLERAYADFVNSDAQAEKVFRVFRRAAGIAHVPLGAIGRGRPA
ncbi:MAG TPA: nitrogenase-stabilizing/protective protein NifW [Rhodocyclaceae bacterium]